MAAICRRYFQLHFLQWKSPHFNKKKWGLRVRSKSDKGSQSLIKHYQHRSFKTDLRWLCWSDCITMKFYQRLSKFWITIKQQLVQISSGFRYFCFLFLCLVEDSSKNIYKPPCVHKIYSDLGLKTTLRFLLSVLKVAYGNTYQLRGLLLIHYRHLQEQTYHLLQSCCCGAALWFPLWPSTVSMIRAKIVSIPWYPWYQPLFSYCVQDPIVGGVLSAWGGGWVFGP